MNTRLALIVACCFAFLTPLTAQIIPVTDVLSTPQFNVWLDFGNNAIQVCGPPGLDVNAYASLTGAPPDNLTWYQINNSGPNDVNFVLGPTTYTMTTTLDATGQGTLDIYGDPGGGDILPQSFIHLTLTASSPGSSILLVETKQLMLQPLPQLPGVASCSIMSGCVIPGGSYRGPGDTVPPNLFPGTPFVPGTNGCGSPATQNCVFAQPADVLGCPADTTEINVKTYKVELIDFDCIAGEEGDFGQVPFGFIYNLVCNATTEYVDFIWRPSDPFAKYEVAFNYPTLPLQAYCVEWLWMRDPACTSVQVAGELIGFPVNRLNPLFNAIDGFHFPATAPNPFDRSNGSGAACVRDVDCTNSVDLVEMRVRYKRQCIKDVLDAVLLANPFFFTNPNTVIFAFGGSYCPQGT